MEEEEEPAAVVPLPPRPAEGSRRGSGAGVPGLPSGGLWPLVTALGGCVAKMSEVKAAPVAVPRTDHGGHVLISLLLIYF